MRLPSSRTSAVRNAVRSDDARRLLHVVGDDDDRVLALQLGHQVFDPAGRDRVERRSTARP